MISWGSSLSSKLGASTCLKVLRVIDRKAYLRSGCLPRVVGAASQFVVRLSLHGGDGSSVQFVLVVLVLGVVEECRVGGRLAKDDVNAVAIDFVAGMNGVSGRMKWLARNIGESMTAVSVLMVWKKALAAVIVAIAEQNDHCDEDEYHPTEKTPPDRPPMCLEPCAGSR